MLLKVQFNGTPWFHALLKFKFLTLSITESDQAPFFSARLMYPRLVYFYYKVCHRIGKF